MDNPGRLVENWGILSREMDELKKFRDEVARNKAQQMASWLANVKEKVEEFEALEYEFKEFQNGSLGDRHRINKKVLGILRSVTFLQKEVGNVDSDSIMKLFSDIAGENLKRYTHAHLFSFTSNFSNPIDTCGNGNVYRGEFPSRMQIVVKKFTEQDVVEEIFIAEMNTLLKTSHRNLVKLYGFCFEKRIKALVFEYMPNGSLDKILFDRHHRNMEWEKLYEIATETAKGVSYLHDGCEEQLFHCDLKASNVLLDSSMCPKLTNFGVSKLMSRDKSHLTMSKVRGDKRYAAPEMMQSAHITSKCDVYSFGMILFEVLGRRRNIEGKVYFPKLIWDKFVQWEVEGIIKECDIEERSREKARTLCMVAFWCIQYTPENRPSMSTVVKMLEKDIKVMKPPYPFSPSKVYSVKPFSSRVQSYEAPLSVFHEQDAFIMANHNSLEAFLSNSGEDKPKQYTYEDLKDFTSDFSNKIGVGGFAIVYKGLFSDGTEIAVKVLTEKGLVKEVFMAEVNTMMKASHPNLVTLHGFCFSDSMKALVYEFMLHGSLDRVLYENHLNIKWQKLYGIMIDTAKGLSHLHHGCVDQIIHADVKAANILLDSNLSPKVTDFGLAKFVNRDTSHFTLTRTRGTPGYAAPETWMPSSVVTYKCDVYSFGMMLFEVLGRRRNHQNGQWFPTNVWEKFKDDCLDEILDDCGIQWDDRGQAKILSVVALWCVQFTPELRPSMSSVVKVLEEEVHVTSPPNPFFPSTLITSMLTSQVPRIDESENSEILFKYIEAAVKSGQIREVERITRESNFYDPERTKNFLMEAKLSDLRPLVNVCDRFGFIADLTHYLYTNNELRFIEDYVQKINPGNAPLVVGKLLDDKCPEDFIKGLLSARFQLPVEPLVEECEKRNRLDLLTQFLEQLVSDGSEDVHVHNALGKIIVDGNNNPEDIGGQIMVHKLSISS